VPYYTLGNDLENSDFWFLVMLLVVVVVLCGLEVTLLAGAAFAVGARRQARSLGLLAAAGGSRRHVRSVVLAGGLVLGAAGAVTGVALGLVAAAVARPILTDVAQADFGRFDVRPLELLAIALLGLVTGLLAAVLPARTAARQDPVVALTGRRGQVRTPRKVPVIGVVLAVVGVGCAALGSTLAVAFTTGFNPLNGGSTALVAGLIAGGAALAQIGLIVTSPAIIGLAGRWSRRLPLAGRLALRDAARHRGRSAPAMAAVLTAVTGSTALVLYVAALDAHDREQYTPSWPAMTAGVQLTQYDYDPSTGAETQRHLDAERVLAAVSGELPPFQARVVRTTDTSCTPSGDGSCMSGFAQPVVPPENQCFLWVLDREATPEELRRAESDPLCNQEDGFTVTGGFAGTPVGDAEVVRLVAGRAATPEAAAVLRRGGVVVFSAALVRDDGTVVFDVVSDEEAVSAEEQGRAPEARQVVLPGAYVPTPQAGAEAVYSPAAADELGLRTVDSTLLMRFDTLPTTGEEEAAAKALDDAGLQTWFSVERGYVSGYGLGLLALVVGAGVITLGAAGIATGLAQADARADHATLAAIGAAPRLRRTLAAAQALSISGMGTALGVAAGFVPAVALIGAIPSLDLVIPWWQLAQVMVVVPLLAGLFAWLLTRSRVPLERRVA
jgi:putative ABC transport system permease protein